MPTVARVIADTLRAYDVEYFFCVTGGDQALWIALEDAGITVLPFRSEAGAVYAADAYARVTGRPTPVYGQYGPGVTNVAASLADSMCWLGMRWLYRSMVVVTDSCPSRRCSTIKSIPAAIIHEACVCLRSWMRGYAEAGSSSRNV